MRIDILRQFLTICSEGSINTAAQQLYISQQGLDSAIKRLEKEINLTLFHRSKNGVTLTADGELLKKYAEQIISSFDAFELAVARLQLAKSEKECTLSIAANPLLTSILSDFILQFNAEDNHISCRFFDLSNEDIPSAIINHHYDIGLICYIDDINFLRQKPELTNLMQLPIMVDPLTVSFGKQHPLAEKRSISKEDFSNCKLTVTNNTKSYDEINDYSRVLLCSNDFNLHQSYLRNNNCACLLPSFLSERHFDKNYIHVCYLEPTIQHKTIMVFPKAANLTPQQLLFFRAVKKYFQSL